METNYLNNLDVYEVEPADYRQYVHRCRHHSVMKTTPKEGLTIWKDINSGKLLYGEHEEIVMEMPAKRYFIFELLPESELGTPLVEKHIEMPIEKWNEFVKALQRQANEQ